MTDTKENTSIQVAEGKAILLSDLLSVAETCTHLGVVRKTLWNWVRRGKIAPIRSGCHNVFLRSDLDVLLSSRDKV